MESVVDSMVETVAALHVRVLAQERASVATNQTLELILQELQKKK